MTDRQTYREIMSEPKSKNVQNDLLILSFFFQALFCCLVLFFTSTVVLLLRPHRVGLFNVFLFVNYLFLSIDALIGTLLAKFGGK